MKKIILLYFFALFIISNKTHAQSYQFAVGGRGGFFNGLSGKYFLGETKAIEGILSRRYRGYSITGLYEIQKATKTTNLSWFYGVGAHIASYNSYYYYGHYKSSNYYYGGKYYTGYYGEPVPVIGVDAIIGVEYRFKEIPFTVGFDVKPYFDLLGGSDEFWDGALSIRYIVK